MGCSRLVRAVVMFPPGFRCFSPHRWAKKSILAHQTRRWQARKLLRRRDRDPSSRRATDRGSVVGSRFMRRSARGTPGGEHLARRRVFLSAVSVVASSIVARSVVGSVGALPVIARSEVAGSVGAVPIVARCAGAVPVVVGRGRRGSAPEGAERSADQRAGRRSAAASGDAPRWQLQCLRRAGRRRPCAGPDHTDPCKPKRPSPIPGQMHRRKLAFSLPAPFPHGCPTSD